MLDRPNNSPRNNKVSNNRYNKTRHNNNKNSSKNSNIFLEDELHLDIEFIQSFTNNPKVNKMRIYLIPLCKSSDNLFIATEYSLMM